MASFHDATALLSVSGQDDENVFVLLECLLRFGALLAAHPAVNRDQSRYPVWKTLVLCPLAPNQPCKFTPSG